MAKASQNDDANSRVAKNVIDLELLFKRICIRDHNQAKKCHVCGHDLNLYTYQCLTCKNGFKLCSNCFSKGYSDILHKKNHPMVRYDETYNGALFGVHFNDQEMNLASFEEKFNDSVHRYVKCAVCNAEPIKGLRFKCDVCFDFDLCLKCFKETQNIAMFKSHRPQEHSMIVIGETESLEIDIKQDIDLLELLDSGAFGAVHRAHYKRLNKIVACKIIQQNFFNKLFGLNSMDLIKSFIRELAVFKQVKGDNIHRLIGHSSLDKIDLTREDTKLYIVTELMEKGNLTKLLEKEPGLSYSIRLDIAIGICSGMARIHDLGFIHRDIRPENILIDANYIAKIADMGIAKVYENNCVMTPHVGCGEYMPPEFPNYTRKLDIFTYGLTLNKIFEGDHYFDKLTRTRTITKEAQAYYDIVEKCISDRPEERPEAREIERLLRNYDRTVKMTTARFKKNGQEVEETRIRNVHKKVVNLVNQSEFMSSSENTKSRTVQICFLIDITENKYSRPNKNGLILKIVDAALVATSRYKCRLSYIGYRERNEEYEFHQFTDNVELIREAIKNTKMSRGGYTVSDVEFAFELFTKKINFQQKGNRLVIHLAETPCHGLKYHESNIDDNHLEWSENIPDLLQSVKNNFECFYWFVKINQHTDKMIAEFNKILAGQDKIREIDLSKLNVSLSELSLSLSEHFENLFNEMLS